MNPVGSLEDDSSRFGRLTDRFLPDNFDDDTEQLFRARVVVACSFAIAIFGPVYAGILYALTGSIPQAVATMAATAGVVATPWLMRRGVSFTVLGNWMTFCGCALFTYVATQTMGPSVLMWQVVFVILVALIAGRASALGWVAVMSTTTIYFYMSLVRTTPDRGATVSQTQLLWEMSLTVGMFVAVLVLTLTYEALKDWALDRFRKREYHTRAMLQAAPDGVITLTPDGRIADMNAAAQHLFDHDRESARLAPVTTLVPEIEQSPPEPADEHDEHAPADGEIFREPEDRQDDLPGGIAAWTGDTYEVEAVRRDASRFPAELSVSQIDDGRFIMIVRDVTDWKDTREKLRLARDQAVQANEAKSRFLANISHELRTPLNAIIGYSELMTEDLEGTEQDGLVPDLERIHKAGEHLLSLINDILDLSKVEAGKMDLHLEEVDLPDLVDEVTGTVEPLIAENQNTLRVDIAEAPETMHVDRQKLRQMLLNLLSNAAKFTDNSLVRIHAFAEEQNGVDCCVFEVIDRGVGIPEEDLEELFEAFSQADESSTREHEGTGLGLTITKRFTEMMHGDIDVESQLGEGSTFRITLPVDVESPGGELESDSSEPADEPEPDESDDELPTPPPNAPQVLVIDDDPTVHELMERFLTREGFAVETAQGGERGLQKARELQPDVITLDVLMPQVDGWNTLERLKDDEQLADIPVVMVTIIGDKNMGFSLGASDYLTKPVDRDRLADVLAEHAGTPDSQPILIAEDDADTRELLERTIERSGWEAKTAENGRQALDKLEEGVEPEALLLDLMMPELDGFELLDEIRERPEFDNLPVIVVSAADLSDNQRRRLDENVDRILHKGEHAREQLIDELHDALEDHSKAAAE
jgi:signal transduction histidine kinase/DNA-binding response OmpR family regulator